MNILDILFFSVLQSLTEFLPVSSSAHLFLLDYFTTLTSSKSFDVALHVGTVIAILVYFYKDIFSILQYLPIWLRIKKPLNPHNIMPIGGLIISCIPAIFFGIAITFFNLDDILRSIPIIAINLIIFGCLLYWADNKFTQHITFNKINILQGTLIGLAQALALVPGVSRSGVCFTMARLLGIEKQSAIKFSMLISIPVILGAAILQFSTMNINNLYVLDFFVGAIVSFIFGLLVIKFLLFFITKFSFKVFMIYRIILGILILVIYFL